MHREVALLFTLQVLGGTTIHTGACALIWIENSSSRTPTLKTANGIHAREFTHASKLLAFIHICKQKGDMEI